MTQEDKTLLLQAVYSLSEAQKKIQKIKFKTLTEIEVKELRNVNHMIADCSDVLVNLYYELGGQLNKTESMEKEELL